jgi:Ca2+-binding RTX toxin-like protein
MRKVGTFNDDRLIGGNGDDTLVGERGSDLLLGGKGEDQLWGYTDGWGGKAPPDWDNGADTFVYRMDRGRGTDGHDTIHLWDPAHDDTLLLVDRFGKVQSVEELESRVTVTNGDAANFETAGDVTIAWKDGSGSITLDNFFAPGARAEIGSLADLGQHLEIAVARDWG